VTYDAVGQGGGAGAGIGRGGAPFFSPIAFLQQLSLQFVSKTDIEIILTLVLQAPGQKKIVLQELIGF
jgi:hypothetical protein